MRWGHYMKRTALLMNRKKGAFKPRTPSSLGRDYLPLFNMLVGKLSCDAPSSLSLAHSRKYIVFFSTLWRKQLAKGLTKRGQQKLHLFAVEVWGFTNRVHVLIYYIWSRHADDPADYNSDYSPCKRSKLHNLFTQWVIKSSPVTLPRRLSEAAKRSLRFMNVVIE